MATDLQEAKVESEFCQRWRNGRHSFRHASDGGFDANRYTVEPVDELAAKRYVLENHYSGSYPATSKRYGLFEDGRLAGVMILGIPVQAKVLTGVFPDLQPYTESLELSRFVLDDECPANSESWFLARGFELAAAGGIRGIVSFADPVPRKIEDRLIFPGHIGTIYQATNATYTGRGTSRTLVLLPNGEVFNDRAAQKVRAQDQGHEYVEAKLVQLGARPLRCGEVPSKWLASALDDVKAVKIRHRGCHRYAFAIGETRQQRRRVRVLHPPMPYPKERDAA